MKKILLILTLLLINLSAVAQINLVPNPSFEDTVHCPVGQYSNIIQAKYWFGVFDSSAAYYFNACASTFGFGVPFCQGYGFQYAQHGDAYAGIINGSNFQFAKELRYYAQAKLIDTLSKGKNYNVSFYVSLMDSALERCSEMQAYLAPAAIFKNSDSTVINVFPQISNNSVSNPLISTTTWTLVSDTFTAKGNEAWIIIGNFKGFAQTICDTNPIGSQFFHGAAYYLDNVSVVENNLDGIESINVNRANVYPNPTNDFVTVRLTHWLTTPNEGSIINEQGYEVWNQRNIKEKEFRISLSKFPTGIYILQLKNQNNVITKKIIKF